MRWLLLLALAAGVLGDLQSYTPARGEFPVENRLAQGYIRYVDNNGAERLLAYAYPEPLYGVRRLSLGNDDPVNPYLKAAIDPAAYSAGGSAARIDNIETQDQFRAWCDQRYQALKSEVRRLRAEGKNATPRITEQLDALQQVMSSTLYDRNAVETPETKQAREEQLRIWNQERLKILQLQTEHLRHQAQNPVGIRPVISSVEGLKMYAATAPHNQFIIVEETPEQKKAREEHLRIYNEQLQRLQRLELDGIDYEAYQPLTKTHAEGQSPKPIAAAGPIIGVLAVKTVRPAQQSLPAPVQDTPEVIRAREEHLKLFSEANLKATQYQQQQQQLFKIDDTEALIKAAPNKEEEAERQRDADRRREEARRFAAERDQEASRLGEEQRMREEERLRLQVEENRRAEMERLSLIKALQQKEVNMKAIDTVLPIVPASAGQNGPLLLRIATQPGAISAMGSYVSGNEQPLEPNHAVYYKYAPAPGYVGFAHTQNPFFVRSAQKGAPVQTPNDRFEAGPLPPAAVQAPLIPDGNFKLKGGAPSSDSSIIIPAQEPQPQPQNDEAASLAALEKATREHFRAHEIALEQLRVANLRDAKANSDDC